MPGVAPQHPLQVVVALAAIGHAAAGGVGQRHHPVDLRIPLQQLLLGGARDVAGDRGGTVHAGQHADVVAGADLAAGPPETLERRPLGLGHEFRRPGFGAEGIVALELVHLDIVDMHMVAGGDRLGGEPDDLVVFAHRLADRDRRRRQLVAGRDMDSSRDTLIRDIGARQKIGARDHDVIGRIQPDGQRRRTGHTQFLQGFLSFRNLHPQRRSGNLGARKVEPGSPLAGAR